MPFAHGLEGRGHSKVLYCLFRKCRGVAGRSVCLSLSYGLPLFIPLAVFGQAGWHCVRVWEKLALPGLSRRVMHTCPSFHTRTVYKGFAVIIALWMIPRRCICCSLQANTAYMQQQAFRGYSWGSDHTTGVGLMWDQSRHGWSCCKWLQSGETVDHKRRELVQEHFILTVPTSNLWHRHHLTSL